MRKRLQAVGANEEMEAVFASICSCVCSLQQYADELDPMMYKHSMLESAGRGVVRGRKQCAYDVAFLLETFLFANLLRTSQSLKVALCAVPDAGTAGCRAASVFALVGREPRGPVHKGTLSR